jgi:DNA polymerase III subunit epsilon
VQHLILSRPLAFFDFETTGLDPIKDRIVEWSVLRYEPWDFPPVLITRRCNPCRPIPAIHGITDLDVAHRPTLGEQADQLAELLDGADLSGFGVRRFDFPFLLSAFRGPCDAIVAELMKAKLLDVMDIYHAMVPYSRSYKRTLSLALATYCKRSHVGAHGSAPDVQAAADVLDAMVDHFSLPRRFEELYATFDYVRI